MFLAGIIPTTSFRPFPNSQLLYNARSDFHGLSRFLPLSRRPRLFVADCMVPTVFPFVCPLHDFRVGGLCYVAGSASIFPMNGTYPFTFADSFLASVATFFCVFLLFGWGRGFFFCCPWYGFDGRGLSLAPTHPVSMRHRGLIQPSSIIATVSPPIRTLAAQQKQFSL